MSIFIEIVSFAKTYTTGVIAASISTGFASYMVFNEQVIPELPNVVVRHNPVVSPLNGKIPGGAVPKQWLPKDVLPLATDQILTGSLPQASEKPSGRAAKGDMQKVFENQLDGSFGRYVLRIATNKIALVEGRGKLWSIRPGGLLPGSGRVLKIIQRDKKWVVVTTHGEIKP